MSLELWVGIVAILGTLITIADRIFVKPYKNLEKKIELLEAKFVQLQITDAAQEVKITTIWADKMIGAKLSAEKKGLGEMNSPLKINDKARSLFTGDLANKLQAYYREHVMGWKTSLEMEMDISRTFRDSLIAIETGLDYNERLAIAVEIAKEGDTPTVTAADSVRSADSTMKRTEP